MLKLPTSDLSRDAKLLLAVTAFFAVSFYGIQVLLKVLYVLRLGFGPTYVGFFNASGALTYMAMSLPAGALGTRYGARRTMIAGGLITVLGMIALPMSEFVPDALVAPWPLASQVLTTLGWAMLNVSVIPALSAVTSATTRQGALAICGSLRGVGTLGGTIVGGLLPDLFARVLGTTTESPAPYRYALLTGAVLAAAAMVPLFRLGALRASAHEEVVTKSSRFPVWPMAVLLVHVYLTQGAWASCQAFSVAYMDDVLGVATVTIGLLTAVAQGATAVAPLFAPRLVRRWGDCGVMRIMVAGMALSLVPMALFQNWLAVGVGRVGVLALAAAWMPALQMVQMEQMSAEWRALGYGAVSMAMGFGFGSVSLAGGYLIAATSYRSVFALGAGLALLGSAMTVAVQRTSQPSSTRG